MTESLDDLVDGIVADRAYSVCWAQQVDGLAKELLDRLEAVKADGGHIRIGKATAAFRTLGVTGAIGRHFQGGCKCPK